MDEPTRIAELERQIERNRIAHDGWTLGIFGVAVLALLASIVSIGLGSTNESRASTGSRKTTVAIELGDLYVRPSSVDVDAGTELIVRVTNKGAMPHDLQLMGMKGTDMMAPGATKEVSFGTIDATTQAWCTVPGHKAAGMVLDIKVSGSEVSGSGGATAATIDFAAKTAPDFVPFDPVLKPAPGGTEHKVTFHATEKVLAVAPGVTQEMWTFNDQVPGPILRGHVGDLFTITLVNDGKLPHSIDFHASKVAWNVEMRTIQPGESLVYQYQAKFAGIFMYHCGTPPALHHIGNGMYGAVVIDPPDLPPVDHEYVLVQSELYLGPEGQPGDLTKMAAEQQDAVVFNGYVNQYRDHPIRVEPNQRIRVWVLDAGPSENSAFHIVGTIFDTVFKEGTFVLRPDVRHGGSQVLDLQPAQGGFVEFTFDDAGLYPIVTHKFANVGKGALGLFQAGDVAPTAGGH